MHKLWVSQSVLKLIEVTNLLHSYEWSRFDNIDTKAVESEIRIKLQIHSIRKNRVDSTVLDMYEKHEEKSTHDLRDNCTMDSKKETELLFKKRK